MPRLKRKRLHGMRLPGIRSSTVPSAAIHITAQGGTSRRAPKRGARPTVSTEPCLVSIGEMDERKVSASRIALLITTCEPRLTSPGAWTAVVTARTPSPIVAITHR